MGTKKASVVTKAFFMKYFLFLFCHFHVDDFDKKREGYSKI